MLNSKASLPILWCLPFAGGNSSIFQTWPSALAGIVEVRPIILPGRENRFSEAARDSLHILADEIYLQMTLFKNRKWALFGHSMGGALAWEIAVRIEQQATPNNLALLAIGGRASPELARLAPPIYNQDDSTFIQSLGELGGTPQEVLAERDLMDLLLPTIRADFKAIETWVPTEATLSKTPILVCGGKFDKESELLRIEGWKNKTLSWCKVAEFDGNHFFIQTHRDQLMRTLKESLLIALRED
jgi:medium-chain acyl-[acyl-carrier-protein] hydrolase